jgi:cytoskeleton protein RodZ
MNEMAPPRVAYPQSFGATLRGARERRGLSVGDICARLHLHAKQVRALEAEDLGALPEAPYTRGFLRNYARELDLEVAPLLAAYEARVAAEPATSSTVPTIVRQVTRWRGAGDGGRRLILIGVVVALVVLALIGGLANRRGDRPGVSREDAREATPLGPATSLTPSTPAAPAPGTSPPDSPAQDAVASSAAAPPAPVAAPVAPIPPGNALVLKFSGESWVQVIQADGRVLLARLDAAGAEEQLVAGGAPLSVTIGNAPAVAVEYRGKHVDLVPYTRADAVARLTLP